jgi:hypothetical protein
MAFLLCFLWSPAFATGVSNKINPNEPNIIAVVLNKRQDNSTAPATSGGAVASPTSKTTDIPTDQTTTNTQRNPSQPTTLPTTTSTSVPSQITLPPQTTDKTGGQQTTTNPVTANTAKGVEPSTSTRIQTTVIVTRIGNTDITTTLYTTAVDVVTPTGSAPEQTGQAPSTAPGGSVGSSGLKTSQRNIIIGVVVGIGGAILLGGLAVVLYRLRRKENPVDEDDLMRRDGSPLAETRREPLQGAGTSPFRATLDQYHNRTGPVNAASNF